MMTIEEIAADLEIRKVLARYARGVDRGDTALLQTVYHKESNDDHGAYKGSGYAFATWIVEAMDQGILVGQHQIHNVLIEVDGDSAQVESYFTAWHPAPLPDSSGEEGLALACGRYLDIFEKRDGQWGIADRRVVMDFTREPVKMRPWDAEPTFVRGGRREKDPSYGFFG